MNLSSLSIKRPIFISCLILLILITGYFSMKRLGVDLFPDVTFPVVVVTTSYPGAGPVEVETLLSKPLEEEISTIAGLKSVKSTNKEGLSIVIAEFKLETNLQYAEQQIRDRVALAQTKFPREIKQPLIYRVDPASQPILTLTLRADLDPAKLYDLADQLIKPKLQQVEGVGRIEILGGRKREIRVDLDRDKLAQHRLSVSDVAEKLRFNGQNIPAGKQTEGKSETLLRTMGEFSTLGQIEKTILLFFNNETPVYLRDVGQTIDTLEEEKSRAFTNGDPALFLLIFKQSRSNTIAVVDSVRKKVESIQKEIGQRVEKPKLETLQDLSRFIRANVDDVRESILIGILLTIAVVYFFLGNFRSTFITTLALPNCLLGAFLFMGIADFTINIMTLLALSLSVGLLVDDAIVVRENIFRHYEMGKNASVAAIEGTKEVTLAVIATTLAVLAVFGPIAFVKGIVGQFFKEFGLTICFAMAISLFDALTIAPMLSAYLFKSHLEKKSQISWIHRIITFPVKTFQRFQDLLEKRYGKILNFTLRHPIAILFLATSIFGFSLFVLTHVPMTFLPAQDEGEFEVVLELKPGNSLQAMSEIASTVDQKIRSNREVKTTLLTIGNSEGEPHVARVYVELTPHKTRSLNTSQVKELIREQLRTYTDLNSKVQDYNSTGVVQRPFILNLYGTDLKELEEISQTILDKLKKYQALRDVDSSTRSGKPELQIQLNEADRLQELGLSTGGVGNELRAQIEGILPATFREKGIEYDIRVRLKEEQRDLKKEFDQVWVPNINNRLVKLSQIASLKNERSPSAILRENRGRYIEISADLAPEGPGLGGVLTDVQKMFENEIKLPTGVRYSFKGDAENFQELIENMSIAILLGIVFIYLVLASLYESFITPFTILLVLPLAACGAFYGLFLTGQSLDIFSMIGCILLFGVATKNSILLVDCILSLIREGNDYKTAILEGCKTRLRPILMTSFALIAGMIPVAIGLNEASRQRTSMGIAVIGGLISSTFLTLVVIPAAFVFIDRFRLSSLRWLQQKMSQ